MKVLTFSRHFPKGHPKAGQPTYFVEQVWNSFNAIVRGAEFFWEGEERLMDFDFNRNLPYGLIDNFINSLTRRNELGKKHHTIRSGSRWKAGDMASLRIWSGKPYQSKQIEFAQVIVKRVWKFNIHTVGDELMWQIPGVGGGDFDTLCGGLQIIAKNDGLAIRDFIDWFSFHPKMKGNVFEGQIICWSDTIDYSLTERVER